MTKLRSQVDEVKDVMTQNIERVLDRGERLDELVDKTEDLEAGVSGNLMIIECNIDFNCALTFSLHLFKLPM